MRKFFTRKAKAAILKKLSKVENFLENPDVDWYHKTIRKLLKIAHTEGFANYDPNFGDERVCKCGHPYHRHFDSYEDMRPIGCKYCRCRCFKEECK